MGDIGDFSLIFVTASTDFPLFKDSALAYLSFARRCVGVCACSIALAAVYTQVPTRTYHSIRIRERVVRLFSDAKSSSSRGCVLLEYCCHGKHCRVVSALRF